MTAGPCSCSMYMCTSSSGEGGSGVECGEHSAGRGSVSSMGVKRLAGAGRVLWGDGGDVNFIHTHPLAEVRSCRELAGKGQGSTKGPGLARWVLAHLWLSAHAHGHACTCARTYARTHTHEWTRTHACTRTHTHPCTHAHARTCAPLRRASPPNTHAHCHARGGPPHPACRGGWRCGPHQDRRPFLQLRQEPGLLLGHAEGVPAHIQGHGCRCVQRGRGWVSSCSYAHGISGH